MGLLKSCFNANSLLESVVALSIISVCLYIAVMIYAAVFTPNTTAKFYGSQNKIDRIFFLVQTGQDSLLETKESNNWVIEEDYLQGSKKITVKYKDSLQVYPEKNFYILENE